MCIELYLEHITVLIIAERRSPESRIISGISTAEAPWRYTTRGQSERMNKLAVVARRMR